MRYALVLFICIIVHISQGQSKCTLAQGRPFPYNGKFHFSDYKDSMSIQDFRGRPVIVELFSSTCSVCFDMLPRINKLEKEYKDSIKFLLIGYENGKISDIYRRFARQLGLELTVAFDRKLFQNIEVEALPTYIWIDSTGKVAGVTEGVNNMNAENVSNFIANRNLGFLNQIEKKPFDPDKPYLFSNDTDSNFLFKTALSKWEPGMATTSPYWFSFTDVRVMNKKFINIMGHGLDHLFMLACLGRPFINTDDSLYGRVSPIPVFPNDLDIKQRFCYTVSYSGDRAPDAAQLLLRDLESYFGLKASIETQLTPCWVVTITKENAEKLRSQFPRFNGELDFAGFEFRRTSLKKVIRNIASMDIDQTIPYINETGIDFPIDLKIEAPLSDRELLFAALQEKGIVITLELRPMKVMVLKHEKGVGTIARRNT